MWHGFLIYMSIVGVVVAIGYVSHTFSDNGKEG